MALTIESGVTVQGGITAGNVPIPVPQYSYRFQGTGNGTIYLAMSPGITIGTSDFTIEGWFRSTNVNQQLGLWGDGATNVGGSEPLSGKIGQALIYNRALTSTEIAQNYSSVRARYGV